MQLFSCDQCHSPVFFDNFKCTSCEERLAFLPDLRVMSTLKPLSLERSDDSYSDERTDRADDSQVETRRSERGANRRSDPLRVTYRALAAGGKPYRMCRNADEHDACNWAVAPDDAEQLCLACRLNDVIPNLDEPKQRDAWLQLEAAKRRLLYSLYLLKLPVESRVQRPLDGLSFRFMAGQKEKQVFTGHNDGVITINVAEADDPFREKMRAQLGEAYRTLLGHFRHEIGHYYWDRLIRNSRHIGTYRELFGDETLSYQKALERHYKEGPKRDWAKEYVSAYASMHPWEDWAETWAHYLHIFDTLETAKTYGLRVQFGQGTPAGEKLVDASEVDVDDFEKMARDWVPMTLALNSLNRSMGLRDLYPFVLTETALKKLRFVHEVIRTAGNAEAQVSRPSAEIIELDERLYDAANAREEVNERTPANDVRVQAREPAAQQFEQPFDHTLLPVKQRVLDEAVAS